MFAMVCLVERIRIMRQLPTTVGSWVLAFEPWFLVFVFVVVLVIGSLYWSIGSVFGPYFLLLLYRIGSRSFIPFFLTELSYSFHFFLPFCFYFSPRVIPIYFFSRSL